jgi:predicted alpha/beta hydrolase
VKVKASDGTSSELAVVCPPAARVGVLFLPALGVSARKYGAWSAALAERGVASAVHEWRGAGSSSVRASRSDDWGYRTLLENDIPASLAAARQACPDLRWVVAGHSLGGQFACLFAAMHASDIAGVGFVASGSPYWRTFPPRQRWLLRLVPLAIGLVTPLVGYYPGRRLGFAGNEARTLMREWARSSSGCYANYVDGVDSEACLAKYEGPLFCAHLSEDRLCPTPSLEWLLGKLRRVRLTRVELNPADFDSGIATHFSWIREPGPVAQRMAEWIERTVTAQA